MTKEIAKAYYQVAALYRDPETGKTEEVVPPRTYLATSAETAKSKLIREISTDYEDKLDYVELIVRPFQ